ncbi:response regulator transcription factor [Clostridium sp.]|uniref:response regulator transcription factor n=1 Tax=Clostridium sp. TaxID=1506 RepID=UPI0034646407
MYKILIIEDDAKLSSFTKEYLERYNYSVYEVTDFNNIEEEFQSIKPDLLLLDINLPYYDGFYFCRALRKNSNIPIIIISARSNDMDQVMAIELGADDYVTKPFKLEILLSKVKAALRRTYGEYAIRENNQLNVGDIYIDEDNFKLLYEGREVELSKNEFKLIKKLIEKKNRIVSREELFQELWDDYNFVDDNTLTVNITRLKNKFLSLGVKNIIKTKRGVGYILDYRALDGGRNG